MLKLFFLFASIALGQGLTNVLVSVQPGSPTDTHCTGGLTFNDISTTFPTLYWGSHFSCKIPVPSGFYLLRFYLIEPNQTTAGARTFTISINGQPSNVIDIVGQGGTDPNTGLVVGTTAVSYFGLLRINFDAVVRFAVVSQIDVVPAFVFDNIATPGPFQAVAKSFLCNDPTPVVPNVANPVPSCNGLRAATFLKPDGTTTAPYILISPTPALDARWLPAVIP